MNPHQKLDAPSPPRHGLPAPQQALPPIPRHSRRNALSPVGTRPSERQAGLSQIVDRRLEKRKGRTQRTLTTSHTRAAPTQNLDDLHLCIRPLFSSLTNATSPLGPYAQEDASQADLADNRHIVDVTKIKQLDKPSTHGSSSSNDFSIPSSVMTKDATCFEMYGGSRPRLSIVTNSSLNDSGYRLTPIEVDLGVLEVIAAMPDHTSSPGTGSFRRTSAITTSRPLTEETVVKRSSSVTAFELPSGSVVAVINRKPELDIWQRPLYVPGKISIEVNSPSGLNSNLTPIDLLQGGADTLEIQLRNKIEEAMLDETAEFFINFGTGFELDSLNTGLDMFWAESPVSQNRFGFSTSKSPGSFYLESEAGARLPFWYRNLPGETLPFVIEPVNYPDTDSGEWKNRSSSLLSPSQEMELFTVLPRSPGLPSSPLPISHRTPPAQISRKWKPDGRPRAVASQPRIMLRRLLHSASTII
jgi:hypothetical protein